MSKTEEIAARAAKYARIERASDALGRLIGVRRLKPSQQLKVEEMAAGLTGTTTLSDPATGKEVQVPRRFPLMMAAAVCEVDNVPYPFPKNRAELDSVLDMLDDEGLIAVAEAFARLSDDEPPKSEQEVIDAAKN